MKPDFSLTLTTAKGDVFTFARFEIPEAIVFGGEQSLAVHNLMGGGRVVDAMGKVDMPLFWEGLFFGENALARARYLDGLRVAGKPLDLSWSFFAYSVVIHRFEAQMQRVNQLAYRIELEPVTNRTSPVKKIKDDVDTWISDDMATASGLGALIGDGPLNTALGSLSTAIKGVSSFATAVQSEINTVLAPLATAMAQTKTLLASTANTLNNVATLGGIIPNNPISQSVNKITSGVLAATQQPQLYGLQSVLSRMGTNIVTASRPTSTVTQAGGNLYQIGAANLGTPAAWADIARANNLTDPYLGGINTIKIPSTTTSDGILAK